MNCMRNGGKKWDDRVVGYSAVRAVTTVSRCAIIEDDDYD